MTHADVSSFSQIILASLKTEMDKLGVDKLTPVPNDLAKLGNVVKNDVVKKTECGKLVTKVDNIDTTGFVLKTIYDIDKSDLEKKIHNSYNFVKTTDMIWLSNEIAKDCGLAAKPELAAVKNKIPSITGLATNSALNAVENKIPDVSSLVTKTDYHTK